ncbi:MAG TPA: RelA/SpoT family protein [Bacilli bacterium]|nr:RelA/SpoT family protein [Bacilli bacterium]
MNLNYLLESVKKYNNNEKDIKFISNAYHYAEKLHKNQKRQSGEPYIIHPLSVAIILSEIEADTNTIVAGLLHDTLEDTDIKKNDIACEFNPYVAMLVDGVTKIGKISFSSREEEIAGNARKLLSGIAEDVRIVLIKLADRLHNMRTLEFKKLDRQKEIALETMEIFIPLAYYLGCYRIKSELEDLSFKYINPEMYFELSKKVKKIEKDTYNDLYLMLSEINSLLIDNNIPNEIKARTKNIYGIYKRIEQGTKLNEIHDLLALKIMVEDVKKCYLTLGQVHSLYPPVNGRIKDYIAKPKTNMYQSLHTTVFGKGENLVQIQIRTFEMDKIASLGLTAYWQDPKVVMNDELKTRFQFFKSLLEINSSTSDNKSFFEEIKQEVLGAKIYVYTPKGDIIELPVGSTAIDLAYKIHTDMGNSMVAAIINGNYSLPESKLQNKDIVKIITNDMTFGPNKEWVDQCQTVLAKRMIRRFYDRVKL